jgi:uncharacterized membrane protein YkvA (DUF1232 family)
MDPIKVTNSEAYQKAMGKAATLANNAPSVLMLLGKTSRKVKMLAGTIAIAGSLGTDLGTIFHMVQSYFKGEYKQVPYGTLVKLLTGILYFVFIVDLIPDFIPIIGLMDDAAIVAWIIKSVKHDVEEFKQWESLGERHN